MVGGGFCVALLLVNTREEKVAVRRPQPVVGLPMDGKAVVSVSGSLAVVAEPVQDTGDDIVGLPL